MNSESRQDGGRIRTGLHDIQKGVAEAHRAPAVLAIDGGLLLEGGNDQLGVARDRSGKHPARDPSLRGKVVNDRDLFLLQKLREHEVEAVVVDQDGGIGTLGTDDGTHAVKDASQGNDEPRGLEHPDRAELRGVDPEVHPG
jgi:hypothetical protein